jgi:DHA1 family bicyclomycin/chloramphenicol resistance-like MFS transporter
MTAKQEFSHRRVIFFLGVLYTLTPFTIDLYLPAFSDIAGDLGTTVPRVSLSVATYFVGFALGQILYGPLLDRFGRRPPMFAWLVLYLLATIGCMTAKTVESLWLFRFLSALGGSALSVGCITMVRDLFPPREGARVFSMLMLVLSVSPLFAPTVGAWIAAGFGWRVIFALLSAVALIDIGILALGIPVSYTPDPEHKLRLKSIFRNFKEVSRIPKFRTYSFAGAFAFSGLFVYLTGSPAIFIEGFGFSKSEYGLIFALLAGGMIGAGQLNNIFLKKRESPEIFRIALFAQVAFAVLFLASVLVFDLSATLTIAFLFLIMSSVGLCYPNAASAALSDVERNVGSASALLGFTQMGIGAGLASLVGLMNVSGTLPTALVMALSSTLALLFVTVGSKRRQAARGFAAP